MTEGKIGQNKGNKNITFITYLNDIISQHQQIKEFPHYKDKSKLAFVSLIWLFLKFPKLVYIYVFPLLNP